MSEIKGIITALMTPMHEDESINEEELRAQVNRQIEEGIHGIFCLGTNGEFYALSFDEKIRIMAIVLEEAQGRIPIIAGAGCISTRETIQLAQKAEAMGADAISVIVPYFVALSQEQIYQHYAAIAEAVSLPIFLYNIPMRTVNHLALKTVQRLSQDYENIVGIKDSSGDFNHVTSLIHETNADFDVFVGTDSLILQTLQEGGKGAVAAFGNLFPGDLANIYNCWKAGDVEQAELLQKKILPIRSNFKLGNPNSILKRTMALMGQAVGPVRRPADINNPEIDQAISKVLSAQ